MAATAGAQVTFGISGIEQNVDGLDVKRESVARFTIPDKLTSEHMEKVRQDLAILSEVAEKEPDKLLDLHNAIVAQDPAAARIADEVGLTEQKMYGKGGGGVWVVVIVIAVGAALLLEHDTPPPTPPPPETLPADAGAG